MVEHTIVIRDEAFDCGFDVEILPAPEGPGHDREFRTHKAAYGYASGLRMATGWKLLDLSKEARA